MLPGIKTVTYLRLNTGISISVWYFLRIVVVDLQKKCGIVGSHTIALRCIEHEFHYVLEFSKLKPLRTNYLPIVYTARPHVLKLVNLLGSGNYQALICLTIFFESLL